MNPFHFIPSAGFAVVLLLAGCSHRTPEAIVEVIDSSRSITPRAEKAALDAVQERISHMQRGDTLVLIPITGNAANDTGGRILRLSAPIQRETYDMDLRRFHEHTLNQFAVWAASLDQHQSRTDILGALDVARQELVTIPKESNVRFVVVSDFLEDDGTYRFVSAGQLATPEHARQFAAKLREQHGFAMQGVPVCLGRLESSDFARLPTTRREAVEAFWSTYLGSEGRSTEIQSDGMGLLAGADRGCLGARR